MLKLFVLSLLLLAPQIEALTPPYYQSHSFNDLDYIVQHLVKGIDFYKVDISMVSKESCLKYSSWKEGDDECLVSNGIEYCCLGFRGDSSSMTFLNDHFNTTTDLVNLVNSTKLDFIYKRDKRDPAYNSSIKIAINYQNVDPTTAMSKKFLYNLISIIEDRNLDIWLFSEIITYYDLFCYTSAKSGHKKELKLTEGCDDQMKRVAKFKDFYRQSSRFAGGDDRTINFNSEFPDITGFCDLGISDDYNKTPYVFYEVAHETDVKFIVDTYTSPQCKRGTADPPLETLRITSNIDPELLEVWGSDLNNFGLNLTNVSYPRIELVKELNVVVFGYTDQNNVTHLETRSFNTSNFLEIKQRNDYPDQTLFSLKAHNNTILATLRSTADLNNYTSLTLTIDESTLALTKTGDQSYGSTFLANEIIGNTLFDLKTFLGNNILLTVSSSGKTVVENILFQGAVRSADISVFQRNTTTISGLIITETLLNNKSKLVGSYFDFDLQSFDLDIVSANTHLDFGSQPFIKVIQGENGDFYALEMHSNGMCQCGTGINNGNINKCSIATSTRAHVHGLQNTKYSLNYNWGLVSSFVEKIKKNRTIPGACDSKIMHGKFNNGEYPNGFVYKNETTGELKTFFVNQNVYYADLPFVTKLFCGGTMPDYGRNETSFRMQSFRVLDYPLFRYLN